MDNSVENLSNGTMPRNGICSGCGTPFKAGMKFCATCGKTLTVEECIQRENVNANSTEGKARYCSNCGNRVDEKAVVCVKCGCALNASYTISNIEYLSFSDVRELDLLNTLTQRMKTNGIVWLVIAIIQILLGLYVNWACMIVGVLNLISSIQDIKDSKSYKINPIGIVSKEKPLVGSIVVLAYNLLIGGVIGVIGSIYYLIAVRGFVMENETSFLQIEKRHQQLNQSV